MNKQRIIKEENNNSKVHGTVRIITTKAGTNEVLRDVKYKNLVMNGTNTGINLIAQRLANINTYTANITHGAIGTGTTPPVDANTSLQAQTVQVAYSTISVLGSVVTVKFFFPDGVLANGTYNEFGTKVDTTQLFNRAIFGSPYIKASGEDTTVEVVFTISNV